MGAIKVSLNHQQPNFHFQSNCSNETLHLFIFQFHQLGSTTVGVTTPTGVIIGVEKRVQSSLLESSSVEKIMEIDYHVGCAMSGLTADARTMVDHARVTAQVNYF